jgi:hypothetical protein
MKLSSATSKQYSSGVTRQGEEVRRGATKHYESGRSNCLPQAESTSPGSCFVGPVCASLLTSDTSSSGPSLGESEWSTRGHRSSCTPSHSHRVHAIQHFQRTYSQLSGVERRHLWIYGAGVTVDTIRQKYFVVCETIDRRREYRFWCSVVDLSH